MKFATRNKTGPPFANLAPDKFGKRGGNGTKVIGLFVRQLGLIDLRLVAKPYAYLKRTHFVKIPYSPAPAGSGKTFQIQRRAIRLAHKGYIVLILQPTIELIDKTIADLRAIPGAPPCRAFHSGLVRSGKALVCT